MNSRLPRKRFSLITVLVNGHPTRAPKTRVNKRLQKRQVERSIAKEMRVIHEAKQQNKTFAWKKKSFVEKLVTHLGGEIVAKAA